MHRASFSRGSVTRERDANESRASGPAQPWRYRHPWHDLFVRTAMRSDRTLTPKESRSRVATCRYTWRCKMPVA